MRKFIKSIRQVEFIPLEIKIGNAYGKIFDITILMFIFKIDWYLPNTDALGSKPMWLFNIFMCKQDFITVKFKQDGIPCKRMDLSMNSYYVHISFLFHYRIKIMVWKAKKKHRRVFGI